MKTSTSLSVLSILLSVSYGSSISFVARSSVFGLHRGGDDPGRKNDCNQDDEFERAEKAILDGIASLEHRIEKVVQEEVETLFHGMDDPGLKPVVHERARKAVAQGVEKVKSHIDVHKEGDDGTFPYEIHNPFEWPSHKEKGTIDHRDSRILQAVEAAERAVLHAVEQEVDTLFHPDHKEKTQKKNTEDVIRAGVTKMKDRVKDQHDDRRKWLAQEGEAGRIEDYIRFALE